MGKPLIVVGSITYAMKGRDILALNGIRCSVERTLRSPGNGGCGYSIYVPFQADRAQRLLSRYGIPVSGRAERGGRP